jgi:hypothetical protein
MCAFGQGEGNCSAQCSKYPAIDCSGDGHMYAAACPLMQGKQVLRQQQSVSAVAFMGQPGHADACIMHVICLKV